MASKLWSYFKGPSKIKDMRGNHKGPSRISIPGIWKCSKRRNSDDETGSEEEEEVATRQNPVQETNVNLMTQTDQRHVIEQSDQSEQTGREQEKDSQQTEGEQEKDRQQVEQTGGDQGDDESYTEEEAEDDESYRPGEESDSEEEESKQTGRRKRKTHCPIKGFKIWKTNQPETQTPPGTIRIGLLNVHSMNPRISEISELITRNKLDVFLTTETWLTDDTADRVLSDASPEGFRFHYQVRTDGRRGGGVAIQFLEKLKGEQIHFDFLNMETFEFVVTELQHDGWDQPVVIINLYLPPGYDKQRFRRFLNEFQSLLDEVKKNYSSIIVTGDFNIHVNNERRSFTDEFYHVWQQYNLTQHVEEPTHRGGNTLDLVITTNVEVSDLSVQDDGVSDHYTVYFTAKPKGTTDKTEANENKEQKRFRQTEE